jgi:hypothetical protein
VEREPLMNRELRELEESREAEKQKKRKVSHAGSKAKGSRLERATAAALGGKRTPLSGGAGGNDITLPSDSIWLDWAIECKARGKLPVLVTSALAQATQAVMAIGSRKRPAAVLREDGGRILWVCELDHLVEWASALAEMGQGQAMKSRIRQIRRELEDLEKML